MALGSGATANLLCSRRIERQNQLLEKSDYPEVSSYPSTALFRSGDGRLGEVRHAADIPAGLARNKGE